MHAVLACFSICHLSALSSWVMFFTGFVPVKKAKAPFTPRMIAIKITILASFHTSEWYRLFILSTCSSAALNSPARYSRMDSDYKLTVGFNNFITKTIHLLCICCLLLTLYCIGDCERRLLCRDLALWVCQILSGKNQMNLDMPL